VRCILSAVPQRTRMVNYLAHHIPQLEVVWDREGRGGWANFMACLELAGDDGYLHLEDDVTLCKDFLARAALEIRTGFTPIQFFSLGAGGQSGPRQGREFLSTLCVWFPPHHARAIRAYMPRWRLHGRKGWWDNGRKHYDLPVGDLWAMHGIRFWTVIPNLVQHLPTDSVLGHPGGRLSQSFRDPEMAHHPHPELLEALCPARG